MKQEFESIVKQNSYVSNFVKRYTNLEKKCQFCGKDALIKNNYHGDPYKIQLICRECRNKYHLNNDLMSNKIPLIDIRDYINNNQTLNNMITLNEENKSKIDSLFNLNITKTKAAKHLGLSKVQFDKLINQYEELYDPNIKDKLNEHFLKVRSVLSLEWRLTKVSKDTGLNNLKSIKLKKKLSNREISNRSNGLLTISSISNIQTGKSYPTIKVKCKLAEVLDVSIKDIFPEDTEFGNIRCYNDYLDLYNNVRDKIITQHEKQNMSILQISKYYDMSYSKVYSIINNTNDKYCYLSNQDVLNIKSKSNI